MIDPLTLSTGVAGLCSLTIELTKILTGYVQDVRAAPTEARDLLEETKSLGAALQQLIEFLQSDNVKAQGTVFRPDSGLCAAAAVCQDKLQMLLRGFEKRWPGGSSKGKFKLHDAIAQLKWPFDKKECQRAIEHLHRCKETFQFALTVSNCDLLSSSAKTILEELWTQKQNMDNLVKMFPTTAELRAQQAVLANVSSLLEQATFMNCTGNSTATTVTSINSLLASVQSIQLDTQSRQIYDGFLQWISPIEHCKRHRDVRARRVSGTGEWFLQDARFQAWCSGSGDIAKIHCYGIPGAGKTIMTSLVVDHLSKTSPCRPVDSPTRLGYVYCDYRDTIQQTSEYILRVLLRGLLASLPTIPESILDTYQVRQEKRDDLEVKDLEQLLLKTCSECSPAFVCIDALDELGEDVVRSVLKILCGVPLLRLLTTSRDSARNLVERFIDDAIIVEIEASEEDVKLYVAKKIDEDAELDPDLMDAKLKDEIVQTISESSKGMFLLPALQIRSVLLERTRSNRRSALQTLPRELYVAYDEAIDRILAQPQSYANQARDILMWVSLAVEPLSIVAIFDALRDGLG